MFAGNQGAMPEGFGLRELLRITTEIAREAPPNVDALQVVIDELTLAALVSDTHGRLVAVNAAAVALTGYTASELTRMSVWQLIPNVKEREAEVLWRAFLGCGEQHGEYPILTKDNHVVTVDYASRTDVLPGLHLSLLREKS